MPAKWPFFYWFREFAPPIEKITPFFSRKWVRAWYTFSFVICHMTSGWNTSASWQHAKKRFPHDWVFDYKPAFLAAGFLIGIVVDDGWNLNQARFNIKTFFYMHRDYHDKDRLCDLIFNTEIPMLINDILILKLSPGYDSFYKRANGLVLDGNVLVLVAYIQYTPFWLGVW